jgi:hypothetical protein
MCHEQTRALSRWLSGSRWHRSPSVLTTFALQARLRRSGIRAAHATGSRETVQHGLSGEALSMFHDAQRNILELNKSRLMALDELKQAKERINELGAFSVAAALYCLSKLRPLLSSYRTVASDYTT